MFNEKKEVFRGEEVRIIDGLDYYSLKDTLECGQCFRYEKIIEEDGYCEYLCTVRDALIRVGQRKVGELIFYSLCHSEFYDVAVPHFNLNASLEGIRADIIKRTDSEWLIRASEAGRGIAILCQDPWEALFSFIISQNNNIPRIRKIIRCLSGEYGENICLQKGIDKCPLSKIDTTPCHEKCKECGICYTFPTANAVSENPEKMLSARVGFRYKYLLDASQKVSVGEINLEELFSLHSYEATITELKKILGVGEKVASCTALFGFGCLDAFPIDVWMKRAIDTYFDGSLDYLALGNYRGVAQQYIFHYIRNLEKGEENKS